MSVVINNLKEAINGEHEAKKKYTLFAEQAKKENHEQIAHLFKAVAFAESIHIKNHLQALSVITDKDKTEEEIVQFDDEKLNKVVQDTISNLENAVEGEIYETKKMYKTFEKNANSEGKNVAKLSFSLARKAEKVHAENYSKYLKDLKKSKAIKKRRIFVCKICGNIEFDEIPDICPVCDHGKEFYKEIFPD